MMEKPSHFSSFDSDNRNDPNAQSEFRKFIEISVLNKYLLFIFSSIYTDYSNVSTSYSITMILIANLINLLFLRK